MSFPAEHLDDFETFLRLQAEGIAVLGVDWPVTDVWGLKGESSQRRVFFISRSFVWAFRPFSELGGPDDLTATFHPDDGSDVVTLAVVTTGTPGSAQFKVADSYVDFEDPASYRLETGDLSLNGAGVLALRYPPARFVTFSPMTRTVGGLNKLTTTFAVQDILPSASDRAASLS